MIGGGPKKNLKAADLSVTIKEETIFSSLAVCWLGVLLEKKLNIKQHVHVWCGKAQSIRKFLRQIKYVQRGVAPGLRIKAARSCVLITALYGAEAWWPGFTRTTSQKGKKVGARTGWHIHLLDSKILRAVRAPLQITSFYTEIQESF